MPDYIVFPPGGTTYISTPDTAVMRLAGDIDLRAKVAAYDWTVGYQRVVDRSSATDGYVLATSSTGEIYVVYFDDAANSRSDASVGASLADSTVVELKATFYVATGVWHYFVNGVEFDNSGNEGIAPGGVGAVTAMYVGGRAARTQMFEGRLYWAEVRNGIDGAVVARMDARDATTVGDADSWVGSVDGLTWTVSGTDLERGASGEHYDLAAPGQLLRTGG